MPTGEADTTVSLTKPSPTRPARQHPRDNHNLHDLLRDDSKITSVYWMGATFLSERRRLCQHRETLTASGASARDGSKHRRVPASPRQHWLRWRLTTRGDGYDLCARSGKWHPLQETPKLLLNRSLRAAVKLLCLESGVAFATGLSALRSGGSRSGSRPLARRLTGRPPQPAQPAF